MSTINIMIDKDVAHIFVRITIENLMIDKELKKALPSGIISPIEPILFIRRVDVVSDKENISKRIFLATTFGAYIFKSKRFSKALQPDIKFSWDTVREIYIPDEDQTAISYSTGVLIFKDPETSSMLDLIMNNLVMIFAPAELPTVSIGKTIPSPAYADEMPQYRRFLFKCRLFNRIPSLELMKSLNSTALLQQSNFDIGAITDYEKFSDLLLDSIEVCPYIKSITIPYTKDNTMWIPLANFMRKNSSIHGLFLEEEVNEHFPAFLQAIIQNPNTRLQSIRFAKTIVSPDSVKMLNDLISMKPIIALSFDNSLEKFRPIVNVFSQNKAFANIRFLTVTHIKGASPKLALQHLPKLIRLDFSYNDIDITPTITEISTLKRSPLREIICSGNYCSMKPRRAMKLPRKLSAFKASNINWVGNNFLSFVKILSRNSKKPGLKMAIDLSYAKVDGEAWELFFQRIPSFPIVSLTVFVWDGNQINKGLFDFLSGSKNISNLSVNDCLTGQEDLDLFVDYIKSNNTIRRMSICGGERGKLMKKMDYLCESIQKKNINVLDIRGQDIQDDIFPMLVKLLRVNKSIHELQFDENKILTHEKMSQFFDFILARKIQMLIGTPKNDLSDISARDKNFRKDQINYILQQIKDIAALPKKRSVLKKKALAKKTSELKSSRSNENLLGDEEEEQIERMPTEDDLHISSSDSFASDDDDGINDESDGEEEEPEAARPEEEDEKEEDKGNDEAFMKAVGDWAALGAPWADVESVFVDDSKWVTSFHITCRPSNQGAIDSFRKDYSFKRLMGGLRGK